MAKMLSLIVCITACLHLATALMRINDFYEGSNLLRCYDPNAQDPRRISQNNINGQALPLPNSVETFISIIEKYESLNRDAQPKDTIQKLLQSFRMDDLDPDLEDRMLRDEASSMQNTVKGVLLNIPQNLRYEYGFGNDDFSDDERCALHLMLSHTINDTRFDEAADFNPSKAKKPLEVGVVSVYSNWNHAFALGRVLMGIHASYLPKEVKINTLLTTLKRDTVSDPDNVNINPVYAVTMGDLVYRLSTTIQNDEIKILSNGIWNDISCPLQYQLSDNNGAFVTYSELRGAIDGLIIGKKMQDQKENYNDMKLSHILRMYYGYYGLLDNERSRWCIRERALQSVSDLQDEMENYMKFYKVAISGVVPGPKTRDQVSKALNEIKNNAMKEMESPECNIQENSADRKFTTPYNIFAILDYANTAKMQFQREVIGNLSVNFDLRPRGSLFGVYTNIKPLQQNMLDTIVKNNGTPGCPSCFAKYYSKPTNKEEESEVLRDLNYTFTAFEEDNEALQLLYQDPRTGSPGRVVLYFNFGSPSDDRRFQDALWDFKRYYGAATFLAVGENKDSLKQFVKNEDMDIFLGSTSAEKTAKDIKDRLKKVPGEFQYKACDKSSAAKEAENKQEVFITPNKMQYWAMYPQYFLKSFDIRLKFKAQDGTQIQVCYTRWFPSLLNNDKNVYCQTTSGEEIEFRATDPCKKKNVFNCDPFYFSVEAKKQPVDYCTNLRCNTPRDIQFEFRHEGVSCNMGSYISISNMAIVLAAILFFLHRH